MIIEAMRAMVDRLTAAGVRACLDKRDLNPPGVMVLPPHVTYDRVAGDCGTAVWQLLVAVPDTGSGPALPVLSELVEQTRAALGYEVTAAIPTTVTTSDGPPGPAYQLTLSTDIGD